MKLLSLTILLFASGALVLSAQTSPDTNHSMLPKMQNGPITIDAAGPAEFDLNRHWATFQDHVVVTEPQLKMTCEWLKANLPQNGERLTNIVAMTNVVMYFTDQKGKKARAMGDLAVYDFHVQDGVTNETVTLTTYPPKEAEVDELDQGPNTNMMFGNPIIYDMISGQVRITGNFKGIAWNTGKADETNSTGSNKNNSIFP